MPIPGFLQSLTDKAQNAISASPLGAHLPGATGTPATEGGQTANQAAAQGGYTSKSYPALESLQHQFRKVQQQYSSASPVQKIITTSKGVVIDLDSVSRDAKAQSKELYTWGQTQEADLKDVTDRLAYINFVHGSLASTLAINMDASRSALKELRDAENQLAPRRNIRAGFETQIGKIEHNQEKGAERKLVELREALANAEAEDVSLEKEVEILKRKAVRESEQEKWAALREYGEKLVLLSQGATSVLSALPSTPPTGSTPYSGTQTTAGARASLQRALDNYKTGHLNLPTHQESMDSHSASTASFGETHGSELSKIHTDDASNTMRSSIPLTPTEQPTFPSHQLGTPSAPATAQPQPHPVPSMPVPVPGGAASPSSPAINPALLNQSPAPLPSSPPALSTSASASSPGVSAGPSITSAAASATPTVAETGIPVTSDKGPGPASGSLMDLRKEHASSTAVGGTPISPLHAGAPAASGLPPASSGPAPHGAAAAAGAFESAEDEKKRLQREDRDRLLEGSTSTAPTYETSDDEKKRLEREERERVLAGNAQAGPANSGGRGTGEDLPPYQEPGLM